MDRYSGKKIKGVLRAVDNGALHIELKDSSISAVEIADIKKIKRPGGVLSGVGGVFMGICFGTGAVLGGIFIESTGDADSGVPFLKGLPGVGHLFKSTTKTSSKNELLIFVTPRILR